MPVQLVYHRCCFYPLRIGPQGVGLLAGAYINGTCVAGEARKHLYISLGS